MSLGKTYRMNWKDVEGQQMEANIWDRLSDQAGPQPYNIQYTLEISGVGVRVTFTFDALPGDTTGLSIRSVDDSTGATNTQTGGFVSPRIVDLPLGIWHFFFIIQRPGGNEIYDLSITYPLVIKLQPASEPCTISVIDNDEDALSVFRAKQVTLKFLSDANLSLGLFDTADCFDDRYYVTIQKNGKFVFVGFLILDDMNEPFLSPRNEVVLKATDRLGTLKDIPMVKTDGTNPRGINRIIDYLCWSLKKTGLRLPVNVIMNVREEGDAPIITSVLFTSGVNVISVPFRPFWRGGKKISITGTDNNDGVFTIDHVVNVLVGYLVYIVEPLVDEDNSGALFESAFPHMYNNCFLDARTFEDDINTSIDCYNVIKYILGELCFITQEKGEWWVKRIDETDSQQYAVTVFDADGNYVSDNPVIEFKKDVKRLGQIFHIEKGSTVELRRPMVYTKEIYNYETFKEAVCNIDFNRGDAIVPPDLTLPESTGTYNLDCWEFLKRIAGDFDQPAEPTAIGEVRKSFEYGYEKDRYLAIKNAASHDHYFKSGPIDAVISDKLSINLGWKQETDTCGCCFYRLGILHVRLMADNGEVYDYQYDSSLNQNFWERKTDPLYVWNSYANATGDTSEDLTEWHTLSADVPQLPATGKLYFRIHNDQNMEIRFSDLRIEYIARINGSYQKYSGQHFKINQPASPNGEFKASREQQVYIANSPRKNFKGALLVKDGDSYILPGRFYNAAVFPATVPADYYFHPFGWLQAFDVFNQFNRVIHVFRTRLKGMSADATDAYSRDDSPGLLHRYRHLDNSPHGPLNKTYHLLSFEQNLDNDQWSSGVFKEVYDSTIDKVYDEALLEFKYLES